MRTDKDLVARPTTAGKTDAPDTHRAPTAAAPAKPANAPTTHQRQEPVDFSQTPASTAADTATEAQDPGPSGWAWASDRDGIVRSLSPNGSELLADILPASNASVLDLLSLNNKLGHPVARAFQRRSAIHDAPILLQHLQTGRQHWTLQATPVFSAGGGIFEGYEGVLMPVVTGQSEVGILQTEEEACALFLDEVTVTAMGGATNTPLAFTNKSSVFPSADSAGFSALPAQSQPTATTTAGTPETIQATKETLEHIAANLNTPADHQTVLDETDDHAHQGIISEAATDLLKDALADMFTSDSQRPPEDTTQKTPSSSSVSSGTKNDSNAHIQATLELLGEALGRLTEHAKTHSEPQLRLQTEIACACLRSLKDQLA